MKKINIEILKKIRKITNFSISKCLDALKKNNNNFNLSLKYLNKCNNLDLYYNVDNKYNIIFTSISDDKKYGLIIKLLTSSDLIIKNNLFLNLINKIINFCKINKISSLLDLKNKFNKEILILTNKFKENISIDCFDYIIDDYVYCYNHINKYGVLISFDKIYENNIAKELSMHIIYNKPFYIYESDILYNLNNKKKILNNNDKLLENNNNSIEKLFLEKQKFIMNTNICIKDLLIEKDIKIKNFKLIY